MSFVGKAVKKVFKKVAKVTKKVVKSKWFKIAVIVGLSLFTAGVAAGGFAAFSGVTTVGGFFSAVGTTMGTGWTALTAGLTGAAVPGATAGSSVTAGGLIPAAEAAAIESAVGAVGTGMGGSALGSSAVTGLTAVQSLPGVSASLAAAGAAPTLPGTALAASGGWLSKVFGTLLKPTIGGSMMRSGLVMGINGYFRAKDREREEYYRENATVWGGKAFGGGSDPTIDWLKPKKVWASRDEKRSVAQQQAVADQSQGLLASPDTLAPAPVGPAPVEAAPVAPEVPQVAQQVPTSQPPPADNQQQRDPAAPPGRIKPELLGVV
jgi:hypothetical protein